MVTVVVQCIQASREEAKRSPKKNSRAMLCLLCYAVDKGNKKNRQMKTLMIQVAGENHRHEVQSEAGRTDSFLGDCVGLRGGEELLSCTRCGRSFVGRLRRCCRPCCSQSAHRLASRRRCRHPCCILIGRSCGGRPRCPRPCCSQIDRRRRSQGKM